MSAAAPATLARPWLAWLLVAGALAFVLPGIHHGLWTPDEPREIGTCAEMARTGDFLVPRLNGEPFLEKPPLYYATSAIGGLAGGVRRELGYRLASLFYGALTLGLVYALLRRRHDARVAVSAVCILASTFLFLRLSRWVQVDIALVAGVTLAMHGYLRWLDDRRPVGAVLLGLGVGLAFLAKGLVGPALIAAALGLDLLRQWDLRPVWRVRPWLVAPVALTLPMLWLAALWHRGGWTFVHEVLIENGLQRFTGASTLALGHQEGPLYYLQTFPADFLPWTLLLLPAVARAVRHCRRDPYLPWFVGPLVILFVAATKRSAYVAPVFPAAACLVAVWLAQAATFRPWERVLANLMWGLAGALWLAPLAVGAVEGAWPLGAVLTVIAGVGAWLSLRPAGRRALGPAALAFTVLVSTAAAHAVHYVAAKPEKDFLGFVRQVEASAAGEPVTLFTVDEYVRGAFSFATGGNLPVVGRVKDLRTPGLYVWRMRETGWPAYRGALAKKGWQAEIVLRGSIGKDQFAPLRQRLRAFVTPATPAPGEDEIGLLLRLAREPKPAAPTPPPANPPPAAP